MAPERAREGRGDLRQQIERVGERTVEGVEEVGLASWLIGQSLFYLGAGRRTNGRYERGARCVYQRERRRAGVEEPDAEQCRGPKVERSRGRERAPGRTDGRSDWRGRPDACLARGRDQGHSDEVCHHRSEQSRRRESPLFEPVHEQWLQCTSYSIRRDPCVRCSHDVDNWAPRPLADRPAGRMLGAVAAKRVRVQSTARCRFVLSSSRP